MEWPLYGGSRYETAGADTAASRGTTLTAAGAAHTKGAYVELAAATGFDASLVAVTLSPGTSHTPYLVDVAVGAAGSEQVIVPDLTLCSRVGSAVVYEFPIHVPAGSRLSARCQCATAAATCFASVLLGCAPWGMQVPCSQVLALGVNTATSHTTLEYDPGTTPNTKNGFQEMVASTSELIRGLVLAVNSDNAAMSDADWLIDIAAGAAGSEVVVLPNLAVAASATSDFFAPQAWPCRPVDIPAGTRISVRAQCSFAASLDRLFHICGYGVV